MQFLCSVHICPIWHNKQDRNISTSNGFYNKFLGEMWKKMGTQKWREIIEQISASFNLQYLTPIEIEECVWLLISVNISVGNILGNILSKFGYGNISKVMGIIDWSTNYHFKKNMEPKNNCRAINNVSSLWAFECVQCFWDSIHNIKNAKWIG